MLHPDILAGSVDQSVYVRFVDSTDGTPETAVAWNTAGIDLWYRRAGGAVVSITEASLAAADSAHADGGFIHLGNGICRLDLPDAAVAAGAGHVLVGGGATGMVMIPTIVPLVAYNPQDAVRMGLTALPNAAAAATGGLPTVDSTNSVKIQTILKKNTALNEFVFSMFNATTNALLAGIPDVTVRRRIDGGALSAGTISGITDLGGGQYSCDFAAADRNGNTIYVEVSGTGAKTFGWTWIMEP